MASLAEKVAAHRLLHGSLSGEDVAEIAAEHIGGEGYRRAKKAAKLMRQLGETLG